MSVKTKPAPRRSAAPSPETLTVTWLEINDLVPVAANPRQHFDADALSDLAASLQQYGVLEPLLVRPRAGQAGQYEIVAGERRYRAALMARLKHLPCRVLTLDDAATAEVRLIENLQRVDLSAFELAQGYQALLDSHGYTVERLAQQLGKSKAQVYGTLKLLDLPELARQAVVEGTLPASTATLIARIPDAALRQRAAEEIVEPSFQDAPRTFRDAKDYIEQNCMRELKSAPFSRKSLALLPEAGSCDDCPKRSGNLPDYDGTSRADVCTAPPCYARKLAAHVAQQEQRAQSAGEQLLGAAAVFTSQGFLRAEKYIDLDAVCHDDRRQRTFGQLLQGKTYTRFAAVNPVTGKKHRLVATNAANKLLGEPKQPRAASSCDAAAPKPKPEILLAAAELARAAVLAKAFCAQPVTLVRFLCRLVAVGQYAELELLASRRIDPELRGNAAKAAWLAWFDQAALAELLAFLAEQTVYDRCNEYSYQKDHPEAVEALCFAGVTWPDLLEQAAAERLRKRPSSEVRISLAAAGLSLAELQAAGIAEKLSAGKKLTAAVSAKPFAYAERLWVAVGCVIEGDSREYNCLPLYPANEFETAARFISFPTKLAPDVPADADDEQRREYYTGVVVRVGKKEYAIAPAAEERVFFGWRE